MGNMPLTEHQKLWHANRRADLRARGMCEDCGKGPIKPGFSQQNKPHRCCETCLQARCDRWATAAMLNFMQRARHKSPSDQPVT